MNRLVALLLFLYLALPSCKEKQEDIMANIKKDYTEINAKIKDYTFKRVDDITNAGGGSINGYYQDEEIKKIIAEHFSDSSRSFTECYFDGGMLILVIDQEYRYNKPVTYTEEKAKANHDSVWYDDKKTVMEVSKYYFNKNKLIKWVDTDGSVVPENSQIFSDKQTELWAKTVILLKELKEQ